MEAARPGHSIQRTAWEWHTRTNGWPAGSADLSRDVVALRTAGALRTVEALRTAVALRIVETTVRQPTVSEVLDLSRVIAAARRTVAAARIAPRRPTETATVEPVRRPAIVPARPRAAVDIGPLLPIAAAAEAASIAAVAAVSTAVVEAVEVAASTTTGRLRSRFGSGAEPRP